MCNIAKYIAYATKSTRCICNSKRRFALFACVIFTIFVEIAYAYKSTRNFRSLTPINMMKYDEINSAFWLWCWPRTCNNFHRIASLHMQKTCIFCIFTHVTKSTRDIWALCICKTYKNCRFCICIQEYTGYSGIKPINHRINWRYPMLFASFLAFL